MAKIKLGEFKVDSRELARQHDDAVKHAKALRVREPQARAVSYDRKQNRLVIEMKNGVTFIVPCQLLEGIANADPKEIAEVALGPRGAALHWEKLDQDLSVAGLLAGNFGTRHWLKEASGAQSRTRARRANDLHDRKSRGERGRKCASTR